MTWLEYFTWDYENLPHLRWLLLPLWWLGFSVVMSVYAVRSVDSARERTEPRAEARPFLRTVAVGVACCGGGLIAVDAALVGAMYFTAAGPGASLSAYVAALPSLAMRMAPWALLFAGGYVLLAWSRFGGRQPRSAAGETA